jgi:phytoene dehydrogenase-like protein
MTRAIIVGSGPNGLAAAVVLAQAGLRVEVYEAEAEPGGALRTLPLTRPGFLHDFGSAVLPMAAGSPFFKSLPLERYGLRWVHGPSPLAHPLEDGSAVLLERELGAMDRVLGIDGRMWRTLMHPLVEHWDEFMVETMQPLLRLPRHPLRMARFGLSALQPAAWLARNEFGGVRARALFAGLAAHSVLGFDQFMSGAAGLVLGAAAHAVGWPVPEGGAGALTRALVAHLETLGAKLLTGRPIDAAAFKELGGAKTLTLFDTTPAAMVAIAGQSLSSGFRRAAGRFKPAAGVFKIDYALLGAVPWRAHECRQAITVHLGGTFEEIAAAEDSVARGRCAEKPFVLTAQPSLFDPTRAPAGSHVFWAYCHVPNGSREDMTAKIEAQIERFAPGFQDCVLERRVWSPAALARKDANLVGGDVTGGAMSVGQSFLRPWSKSYSTGARGLYLCSASTPPGGGVHGMCGANAAHRALREL